MNIYTLKVVDIVQETRDTITLCFKQPGLKKIKYTAGQYLTLIFRINGRRYIRPYSFSSAFGIDETLQVTIKRVLNGIVSNHIHDVVKIGDSIEVMSPMGDFIYKENSLYKEIFLWGTGSGITPLISLAKSILFHFPLVKVNLIYGNRNFEQMIFSDLIEKMQVIYPNQFEVWNFHSQLSVTEKPPFLVQGRITKEKILSIVHDKDVAHSLHYICGPVGLKESVKATLFGLNISVDQILFEDFELVRDPKDFEDITTQQVHINFNNVAYDIEVIKGRSILESALDSGIELPYSCQTGNCSTCVAKLRSGNVKMIGLSSNRDDLAVDDYLLCCSHPVTSNVSVEI